MKPLLVLAFSAYMMLIAIAVIPTWWVTFMISPFLPKHHPWKNNTPGFFNWVNHSSSTNITLGVIFWVDLICIIIALRRL